MKFAHLKLIIAAIIGGTSFAIADSGNAQSRAYDWLTVGEPSGEMIVDTSDDGTRSLSFSFND